MFLQKLVVYLVFLLIIIQNSLPIFRSDVATLALGSRPRKRGYKVAGQEEARESRQEEAQELRQEEAQESHHILPGV